MIALDTNVLARHLCEDDDVQTPLARRFLSGLTPESPGFVGLIVIAELFWVLRRGSRLPAEQCHDIIDALLDVRELEVEDPESVTRALGVARRGADFADALIHDCADLYGCTETVTFDRQAASALGMRLLD